MRIIVLTEPEVGTGLFSALVSLKGVAEILN